MNSVLKVSAVVVIAIALSINAAAQNYTSLANGSWTTPGNWNNTSGWGTSTPLTNGGHGSGTITMNHNMSFTGSYNTGSATLNVNASKTLTINGDMTLGGGSTVNVSGILIIYGNLTLSGVINILPGGSVQVHGSVVVNSSNYLRVGTNVAGPPYADLMISNNLQQQGSGDVTVNRNGRVAVFGSITDSGGGGTFLTLNQGAQMYVDDNITYTGGGNSINNNNPANPYGLYVNGTISNTGGGSSTTANQANTATMNSTNPTFSTWVASAQTLMPVTLLFFKVGVVDKEGVNLNWATSTEINFDYFVVESSVNGTDYTEIACVAGGGNSKERRDYNYLITNPSIGKSYYRLKSVDFDGFTESFNIVSAAFEAAKSVKLFPNPIVDSQLNVDFNFSPSEEVTISITNLSGMEVSRLSLNSMMNLLTLSIEPGTYLLKISSSEFSSVSRIVVR